ncbi:MAG: hypothetical protein QM576_13530 [Rhodopseudomonas sp.]|uniref:hypothetical protein n=1 Tax=Rhodopseudomonas sp. TaxID=1078 RepID=UPI0039E2AF3A
MIEGKTLLEVRDLAKRYAERRGHTIKRWNRRHGFRYTAICEKCRASLRAYSQVVDHPGQADSLDCFNGMLVARDRDRYWTGIDYNWADGQALSVSCR